jgi:hypothetical protein
MSKPTGEGTMSRTIKISVLVSLMLALFVNAAMAQEPRPTPTNVSPGSGGGGGSEGTGEQRGTIQGVVYQDVNGDGRCVNTGIAGEEPVAGVNIEFVSSDGATVITLQSGPDGKYGLAAAGFSYWGVTAKPGPEWSVTSEATIFAPIFDDTPVQTGVNFCIGKLGVGSARVVAVLPEAGASASPILPIVAGAGLGLLLLGFALRWQEKRQTQRN